jgi:hypothetical protein
LKKVPANDTTWKNWNKKYPDTKLLRWPCVSYSAGLLFFKKSKHNLWEISCIWKQP